ncbi:hypothetical protein V2J09_015619 [Rumex salicifolius]
MDLNLKETELRLGLPGSDTSKGSTKRLASEDSSPRSSTNSSSVSNARDEACDAPPVAKAQIVGWPPVRSYRKNIVIRSSPSDLLYVKVSMDGAPYLRKIDLKLYNSYPELLEALDRMFNINIEKYMEKEGYDGSKYAPTYEDKDGDWMLVGDVPWEMFISTCKKLRVMKSSEAKGLGCL